MQRENVVLLLRSVCGKHTEEGRDRRTGSTWGFSQSTCLGAHREPHKERQAQKERQRESGVAAKKKGFGEKEMRNGRY